MAGDGQLQLHLAIPDVDQQHKRERLDLGHNNVTMYQLVHTLVQLIQRKLEMWHRKVSLYTT